MVINISVQYNGGFLPDIILLTQGYYHKEILVNNLKFVVIKKKLIFNPIQKK